ncbi:MAG: aldehyde dehydrogenase [Clostridia bacterium]|nr:aldehyde dehydrogenase [Clostridia bacterium]
MLNEKIQETVKMQHEYFLTGETLNLSFRLEKLKALKSAIKLHENEIFEALKSDLGKSEFESYGTEISLVYSEINHAVKHLKKWMRPKRVVTPIASFGGVSKIYKQPLGTVLVMSPWNYPFMLTLAPVVAAVAAGNCCTIKPSSYSPNTSALIQKIIDETFDEKYMRVFQGNREINQVLLEQKFDHIFFTGSVKVGKLVMQAAASTLTPITLELGGKSPCVVNKDANISMTAARIVWGKTINSGQTCVAPDYVLVHKDVKDELVKELIKYKKKYFGESMTESEDFGKIIRKQAFEGLVELLDGQKILDGGRYDEKSMKIELTLLDNPALDSPVMQREIFGPILPIISVESMDEAVAIIRKYEKPLALYLFTKDKKVQRIATHHLHFGGGCINDTVMHIANGNMPFGGVGESGMGNYHGIQGFDTFSHTKSVLKQNFLFDVPLRYAPYKKKLGLIKMILK